MHTIIEPLPIIGYCCTYCGYRVSKEDLDIIKNAKPFEPLAESKCWKHFNNKHAKGLSMSISDWLPYRYNPLSKDMWL